MKFSLDKKEFLVVIELQEEKLMSTNAPKFKSELALLGAEGYRNLVIDLQHVKFVDSSGLSALLLANRMCMESKGTLALCQLGSQVSSLIKISQLEDILNIFPTLTEALEFVKMEELEREIKG
jgi:anti-sigma B factor antagonist